MFNDISRNDHISWSICCSSFMMRCFLQKYAKEKVEDTEFHQNLPQLPDPEKKGLSFEIQLWIHFVLFINDFFYRIKVVYKSRDLFFVNRFP